MYHLSQKNFGSRRSSTLLSNVSNVKYLLITLFFSSFLFISSYAQYTTEWGRHSNVTGDGGGYIPDHNMLVDDSDGSIYTFQGTSYFLYSQNSEVYDHSYGDSNAEEATIVTKYDKDGNTLWHSVIHGVRFIEQSSNYYNPRRESVPILANGEIIMVLHNRDLFSDPNPERRCLVRMSTSGVVQSAHLIDLYFPQIHAENGIIYLAGGVTQFGTANYSLVNGGEPCHDAFGGDIYVEKYDYSGTKVFGGFYGGNRSDYLTGSYVKNGNLYLGGTSTSPDLPVTNGSIYTDVVEEQDDLFMMAIGNNGSIQFCSYYESNVNYFYTQTNGNGHFLSDGNYLYLQHQARHMITDEVSEVVYKFDINTFAQEYFFELPDAYSSAYLSEAKISNGDFYCMIQISSGSGSPQHNLPVLGGGQSHVPSGDDIYIFKVNSSGNQTVGTYIGNSGSDYWYNFDVFNGYIFTVFVNNNPNYITTDGTSNSIGSVVTKVLNPDGSTLHLGYAGRHFMTSNNYRPKINANNGCFLVSWVAKYYNYFEYVYLNNPVTVGPNPPPLEDEYSTVYLKKYGFNASGIPTNNEITPLSQQPCYGGYVAN